MRASALRQWKTLASAKSQSWAAPVAILECGISLLPGPGHSAIIFILIGKKGNKVSDVIEQAFFFGDYTELRRIWNALENDENFEVESAE